MGRNPIISRESAAAAALRIIDEEGLDRLNLERIATALGVRAPSLYHHFRDKAEILSEVARLVLSEVDIVQHSPDWQQYMIDIALSFHQTVRRHPNAVSLLIEAMPDRVALPAHARAAQVMEAARVDPSIRLLLMEGMEKITWGWTIGQGLTMSARRITSESIATRWPALTRAHEASRWSDEDMLEASLRAFVRGALASAEDPPPASRRARGRSKRNDRPPHRAVSQRSG